MGAPWTEEDKARLRAARIDPAKHGRRKLLELFHHFKSGGSDFSVYENGEPVHASRGFTRKFRRLVLAGEVHWLSASQTGSSESEDPFSPAKVEHQSTDNAVGQQVSKLRSQNISVDGQELDLATILLALARDLALGVASFTLAEICARQLSLNTWERVRNDVLAPLILADIVDVESVPGKGFSQRSIHELRHDRYWLAPFGKQIVDRLGGASDLDSPRGGQPQETSTEGEPESVSEYRADLIAGLSDLQTELQVGAKKLESAATEDVDVFGQVGECITRTVDYVSAHLRPVHVTMLQTKAEIPNSLANSATFISDPARLRWWEVQSMVVRLGEFIVELEI